MCHGLMVNTVFIKIETIIKSKKFKIQLKIISPNELIQNQILSLTEPNSFLKKK